MTDRESRERLIELVEEAKEEYAGDVSDHTETEYIVECLLNNGVIVPPCKVGQTVYVITLDKTVEERIVRGVMQYADGLFINLIEEKPFYVYDAPLHQIFLTREEAEAKLKECEKV